MLKESMTGEDRLVLWWCGGNISRCLCSAVSGLVGRDDAGSTFLAPFHTSITAYLVFSPYSHLMFSLTVIVFRMV